MFIRDQKKDYLLTFRIDLTEELGCEVGVELREPNTLEMLELKDASQTSETAFVAKLKDILPALIVSSDFYESEGKPMASKDVIEVVYSKSAAAMKLMKEYTSRAFSPFQSKSDSK